MIPPMRWGLPMISGWHRTPSECAEAARRRRRRSGSGLRSARLPRSPRSVRRERLTPLTPCPELSFRAGRADARDFPDRRALHDLALLEQLRKDVAQHVRPGRRQEPQRAPVAFRVGIDRDEIQRVEVVEPVALVAVRSPRLPSRAVHERFRPGCGTSHPFPSGRTTHRNLRSASTSRAPPAASSGSAARPASIAASPWSLTVIRSASEEESDNCSLFVPYC